MLEGQLAWWELTATSPGEGTLLHQPHLQMTQKGDLGHVSTGKPLVFLWLKSTSNLVFKKYLHIFKIFYRHGKRCGEINNGS